MGFIERAIPLGGGKIADLNFVKIIPQSEWGESESYQDEHYNTKYRTRFEFDPTQYDADIICFIPFRGTLTSSMKAFMSNLEQIQPLELYKVIDKTQPAVFYLEPGNYTPQATVYKATLKKN